MNNSQWREKEICVIIYPVKGNDECGHYASVQFCVKDLDRLKVLRC